MIELNAYLVTHLFSFLCFSWAGSIPGIRLFYLLIALSWELQNHLLLSSSPNLASNLGLFGAGDKIPYGLAEPLWLILSCFFLFLHHKERTHQCSSQTRGEAQNGWDFLWGRGRYIRFETRERRGEEKRVVGLVGLEPTILPLWAVRFNQLNYKPLRIFTCNSLTSGRADGKRRPLLYLLLPLPRLENPFFF